MRHSGNASWSPTPIAPTQEREILDRRLALVGVHYLRHIAEFPGAAAELTQLAARKEIVFDEEILIGLDPSSFGVWQGSTRRKPWKLIVSLPADSGFEFSCANQVHDLFLRLREAWNDESLEGSASIVAARASTYCARSACRHQPDA